jgi:hypothetical protein
LVENKAQHGTGKIAPKNIRSIRRELFADHSLVKRFMDDNANAPYGDIRRIYDFTRFARAHNGVYPRSNELFVFIRFANRAVNRIKAKQFNEWGWHMKPFGDRTAKAVIHSFHQKLIRKFDLPDIPFRDLAVAKEATAAATALAGRLPEKAVRRLGYRKVVYIQNIFAHCLHLLILNTKLPETTQFASKTLHLRSCRAMMYERSDICQYTVCRRKCQYSPQTEKNSLKKQPRAEKTGKQEEISMRAKYQAIFTKEHFTKGRQATLAAVLAVFMLLSVALAGCGSGAANDSPPTTESNADAFSLADLSNPFIGKWQSDIPSAGMTLVFDYRDDGTFDFEIPGLPADQGGQGAGGYVVYEDILVTWLDIEGAAAYTFAVADNDTINVTELETNDEGELVPGETAPFTRVAGSSVNKEDKPFVVSNDFIGGKWESLIPSMDGAKMISEYGTDGICTVIFPDLPEEYGGGVLYTGGYIVYEDKQVTYIPGDGLGAFTFAKTGANAIDVTEVAEVREDGSIVSGNTSAFTRVN